MLLIFVIIATINYSAEARSIGLGLENYQNKEHKIPCFALENGYELIPYEGNEETLEALDSIVNDPKVYPFMRHGSSWPKKMVIARHKAYSNENKHYLLHGSSSPENLSITWVLRAPNKSIIGRGAIQPGNTAPIISEIMFTIKGEYQKQGLGKKAFSVLTNWFFNKYPERTLRWLATKNNSISIKLANELGFYPVLNADGKQLTEVNWGIKYLVFERKGEKDIHK